MPCTCVPTRFGHLRVHEDDGAIIAIDWQGAKGGAGCSALLREAAAQIMAYERGDLRHFDLPLQVRGSALQRDVCARIAAIGWGETVTYGEIASALSVPAQAVGRACGGNPIPIVIPCHRVMGARGLTGFSGGQGVETKVQLLLHEGGGGLLI